jgi:hypothetical protein
MTDLFKDEPQPMSADWFNWILNKAAYVPNKINSAVDRSIQRHIGMPPGGTFKDSHGIVYDATTGERYTNPSTYVPDGFGNSMGNAMADTPSQSPQTKE